MATLFFTGLYNYFCPQWSFHQEHDENKLSVLRKTRMVKTSFKRLSEHWNLIIADDQELLKTLEQVVT